MSKSSKRIPIIKQHTRRHNWYNRKIKRRQRQQTRSILTLQDILDYEISSSKEIVDDYDVCDWKFDYRHPTRFMRKYGMNNDEEYIKKILRK